MTPASHVAGCRHRRNNHHHATPTAATIAPHPYAGPSGLLSPSRPSARVGACVGRRLAQQRGGVDGERRLRRYQLRLDDEPLARRELRVAGRERQLRVRRVVDDVGVLGVHDELVGDGVGVLADHARGDDLVTRLELVEVEERLAVGGAVSGDRGVPHLAGQGRARIVAGAFLQVLAAGALHEDLVHADLRDLDRPDPVARRGDGRQVGDRRGGRRRGSVRVVGVVVVVAIERLNSARMSSWARAVTRPVPQSWKATNSRISSPTVTKRRPNAAIARRIPTAGYRCARQVSRAVTVRWSTGTLRRLSRPVPCAVKGDPCAFPAASSACDRRCVCSAGSPRSPAPISTWTPARSCSARGRTARARRRCCGCARGCSRCDRARPRCSVTTSPGTGARYGGRWAWSGTRRSPTTTSPSPRTSGSRRVRRATPARKPTPRSRASGSTTSPTVAHGRLSQGQRRRLSLAIALARDPELLLLDEPHAGLDAEGRAVVDAVLAAAPAEGRTVLLASHELDVARRHATREGRGDRGSGPRGAATPAPAQAPAVPMVEVGP